MRCALCRETMDYLHGHAACVNSGCPMMGLNQAPCCDGETACEFAERADADGRAA